MNYETPDCWVFVKVRGPNTEGVTRILCSWYGGFAGSDYWKLSSGNVKTTDRGEFLEILQHSGTVYRLYKGSQRMSGLMSNILHNLNSREENLKLEVTPYEC